MSMTLPYLLQGKIDAIGIADSSNKFIHEARQFGRCRLAFVDAVQAFY